MKEKVKRRGKNKTFRVKLDRYILKGKTCDKSNSNNRDVLKGLFYC